jgi:hypothetical protein
MQFPPAENNPKIACCGMGLKPAKGKGCMAYGKPGQIEMS